MYHVLKKDGTFISFASKQIYNSLRKYIDSNINSDSVENNISLSIPNGLTEKQTKQLFTQIGYDGIRDEIINGNLWIVAHVINQYFKYEKDKNDLVGVAASSLVDFVDNFVPKKNNNFFKCCKRYIYKSIKQYLIHERVHLSLDEVIDNGKELDFNLIDYSLEDLKEKLENKEIIENVLTYLTAKEKTILAMFSNGIPTKEIAAKFNVSNKYALKLVNNVIQKVHMVYVGFKGSKYESFEERIKKYK